MLFAGFVITQEFALQDIFEQRLGDNAFSAGVN